MGQGRSIGIMTLLNVVGAVFAVANSMVLAFFFGASKDMAIFWAASRLQVNMVRLTQAGQLAEVFLPVYHKIRHDEGVEAARGAFAIIVNWLVLVLVGGTALLALVAPILTRCIVPKWDAPLQARVTMMFLMLLPLVAAQAVISLGQMLAHAERRFGWPEAIAVGGRAVQIAVVCSLAAAMRVWVLVPALWGATVFQLAGLAAVLHRMGYRHRFVLRQENFRPAAVFSKLLVTLGYVAATQVYDFALSAALSGLPHRTYAVFGYVRMLYAKTNAVFLRPVSVVFFTGISTALARGARNARELARKSLSISLGVCSVAIAAICVSAQPLVSGLWGGARFGREEVDLAAWLSSLLMLLLLPSAVRQIVRKTNMSLGMVRREYVSASLTQVLTALAALFLVRRFAASGAMAALAFNAIGLAAGAMIVLGISRRSLLTFYPLDRLWRWALAVGAAVALGWAARAGAGDFWMGAARGTRLLWATALAGVSAGAALTVAWLLRVPEVRESYRRLRVRIRRVLPKGSLA